jgi:TPR repeat protein
MEMQMREVPRSQSGSARVLLVVAGACLGLFVLMGALVGGCTYAIFGSMRHSGAYQDAMRELRKDPAAREALGEPIADGWFPTGSISVSGPSGEARLAIPVGGPKGKGTLHVEAVKRAGQWQAQLLELELSTGKRVDLLARTAPDMKELEKRCAEGKQADCDALAVRVLSAQGPEEDAVAARLYARLCTAGNVSACNNLGLSYAEGRGVSRDASRAAALYKQACDAGHAEGCANLAFRYQTGSGVPRSLPYAAALSKYACENGSATGCSNLGVLHLEGWAVRKDATRAAALFNGACNDGSPLGCANLGLLYQDGLAVPRDPARAAALLRVGCDGGVPEACQELERIGPAAVEVRKAPSDAAGKS